jgi:hypothetical protein
MEHLQAHGTNYTICTLILVFILKASQTFHTWVLLAFSPASLVASEMK